ncbi:AAA family ATPase [Patescibacteria group bacterium]|nr:AAA family ATPase [Patescibacteria group bacterium]MBU1029325.1 AAA family ATPase [Patescibacteria group bacterium]MBU1916280.1 AAA family ATPase [Patescibacteria group bacterium]
MDPQTKQVLIILAAIFIGVGVWHLWRRGKMRATGFTQEEFTRDLTAEARAGRLDPVIGREEEIERVINISARRTKNNPLLIGPPGVGKTAIVEGLARRIIEGRVPQQLKNKRVLALNLGELISGTSLRGELEKRFQKMAMNLESQPGATILFIDEIHMISQARGTEGGLDLADLLKPALARGDVSIIGATTWDEYQRTLKKDPALDRRFQPVLVGEPSSEETLNIIRGLKKIYEDHHLVEISDEALIIAVDKSAKKIKGRYLPDKALDIIDEAAAKVSIEASLGHTVPLGIVDAAAKDKVVQRMKKEAEALKLEIKHLSELDRSFPDDPTIKAARQELAGHLTEMKQAENAVQRGDDRPIVTVEDVDEIIDAWTKEY